MKTALFVYDRAEGPLPEALAERLPPWRRERFERIRRSEPRQESLCAGLLLSYALARSGVDPTSPVTLLPAGKPVLAGRDDAFFSLSHGGRFVLCAVSGGPVGADVERVRPAQLSVARRFHPDERAWLEAQPEAAREDALFRLWTRKEAWIKAVSADRVLRLDETNVLGPLPGLTFRDYVLPEGHRAALCATDEPLPDPEPVTSTALLRGNEIASLMKE